MPPTTLFGLGYGTGPAGYGYPPGARRPSISYPDSPFTWYDHVEITAALPTNGGGPITNYSVLSGSLPAGVSLNATTGELTGTPTTQQSAASVVIRARGPGGVSDTTISVEVLAMPLSLGSSLAAWYRADAGCYTDAACLFTAASNMDLRRASSASLQVGDIDFSFVLFVKHSTLSSWNTVLRKGFGYEAGGEFSIFVDASGFVTWRVRKADDSTNVDATSTDACGTSAFDMIEVYHDATNNLIGVRVNNGTAVTAAVPAGVFTGVNNLSIGDSDSGGTSDRAIARVGFWKRLLTAGERTSLYNAGAGKFYADLTTAEKVSLVDYWNLCESSSTRVGSHAGLDLTPTNGPTVAAGPGEGACVDNSPCKRQEDQSGLGFHKTQATITKQPIWTASVHNGRPALVGDGANDLLVTSGDVFSTAYLRVAYALLTMPGSGSARGLGFGADVASVGDFGSGLNQWGYYANEAAGVVSLGGDLTRDIVGIEVASASSAEAYVNDGAATTFDPSATYDPATLRKWVSHCDDAAGSNPGAASISEEILMLAVPTTAQRASIKSYLNTRYAAY